MSKKTKMTPIAAAVGAAILATASMATVAATENPFAASELTSGYQLAGLQGDEHKAKKEGKCGEGKCGGDKAKAKAEGKCGEHKAKAEGKCGEGKCGGDKAKSKAKKEGKCGEGKCGGAA